MALRETRTGVAWRVFRGKDNLSEMIHGAKRGRVWRVGTGNDAAARASNRTPGHLLAAPSEWAEREKQLSVHLMVAGVVIGVVLMVGRVD